MSRTTLQLVSPPMDVHGVEDQEKMNVNSYRRIFKRMGSLTEVFYKRHYDNKGATGGRTRKVNGYLYIILKCAEFDPWTAPPCAYIPPENAIIWKFTVRFKRDNSILQENGSLLATRLSAPLA